MRPQDRPTRKTKGMVSHAILRDGGNQEKEEILIYQAKLIIDVVICLFVQTIAVARQTNQKDRRDGVARSPAMMEDEEEISKYGAKHVIDDVSIFICLLVLQTNAAARQTNQEDQKDSIACCPSGWRKRRKSSNIRPSLSLLFSYVCLFVCLFFR